MIRAVGVLTVASGVAFSPVALNTCLMSCQAPAPGVSLTAHHACHADGASHMGSGTQSCRHDHTLMVDGVISVAHASTAKSLSSTTAKLPVISAPVMVAPTTRATSPPRWDTALQSVAASVLPLRI